MIAKRLMRRSDPIAIRIERRDLADLECPDALLDAACISHDHPDQALGALHVNRGLAKFRFA